MRNFWIAVFLLCSVMVYVNFLGTVKPVPLIKPLSQFPEKIGSFTAVKSREFSPEILANLGVDHYLMQEYRDADGYSLWLYLGFYESQAEGEIIHSPKHCMPGSGWNPVLEKETGMVGADGARVMIKQMRLQKGMDKQLAHYWFQGRGRIIANEYLERIWMIYDSLFRQRSDGSLVRITGSAYDMKNDVERQRQFIKNLLPILEDFISH